MKNREETISFIRELSQSGRIESLKKQMLEEDRSLSLEQALLITDSYIVNEGESRRMNRAYALAKALEEIRIKIYPGELIVGNRTAEVRAGVVSPEAGISWIDDEIESLET
jgi:pyruvate-formate lyase